MQSCNLALKLCRKWIFDLVIFHFFSNQGGHTDPPLQVLGRGGPVCPPSDFYIIFSASGKIFKNAKKAPGYESQPGALVFKSVFK
jgi:hypothetical protein